MIKSAEREQQLIAMLNLRGVMSVAETVELLNISEATTRRLFASLEKEGKAVRSYGGIKLPSFSNNYSFDRYVKIHEEEKRRIGAAAAQQVHNGDSIYLDCGTTVVKMAEALYYRLVSGDLTSLSVVTNSIVNLDTLANAAGCKVILLGGEYNYSRRDFFGSVTEKCLSMFHFKKCFLGCEGWSMRNGFSTEVLGLVSLNARAIHCSDKCFVLMDSSKFEHESLISYATVSEIDTVITETMPKESIYNEMTSAGVKILIAPEK